jgi:COP9 signalosome complex subunit 4
VSLAAKKLKELPADLFESLALFLLQKIKQRISAFEAEDAEIRESLADLYASREDWPEAAKIMAGIKLDSSHR